MESLWTFDIVKSLVLTPLVMGAWMMAWHAWFRLEGPRWLRTFIVALTGVYSALQLLTRPWSAPHLPHALVANSLVLATWVRLMFVLVLGLILVLGVRKRGTDRWLAASAILLVASAIFEQELSAIGIQGIWFPFGVGVSRTQYGLAALTLPMFALLLRGLTRFARSASRTGSPGPS